MPQKCSERGQPIRVAIPADKLAVAEQALQRLNPVFAAAGDIDPANWAYGHPRRCTPHRASPVPLLIVGVMFVWAAIRDGEGDRAIQRRLGIRRKTRLGR